MLGILAALLVGTLLGGLTDEKNVSKVGEKTLRAGKKILILAHLLTNFEMERYCHDKPKFKGV